MTKCIFHKYGGSGTIQRFDALCVLSMNIVNEKIYIFLWFWFIILSVVTGLHLLLRVVQLFMPNVRDRLVYSEFHRFRLLLASQLFCVDFEHFRSKLYFF
jgi:hypothetical protein